ncbi:MAG: SymE family type I addiction module toxin [Bacteroidota bacterium]
MSKLLKVSSLFSHKRIGGYSVIVPFLKLAGIWFQNAGFQEGDIVRVVVEENRIVIEKK